MLEYEGEEIQFPYTPSDYVGEDDVLFKRVGPLLVVGYIDLDDGPSDYLWGDDMMGTLKIFASQDDRDAFIDGITAEKKQCFVVDNYKHSEDHYSIQNTVWYPDRQWDVAPRGVFVPPSDMQERYRKRKYVVGCATARNELVDPSNGILDEYSKWANGQVFGIITFFNGQDDLEEDVCWGYIGYEHATESLKELFSYTVKQAKRIALDMMPRACSVGALDGNYPEVYFG